MPVSAATARELAGTQLASTATGRLSRDPDQLKMFFDQPAEYYRSFRRTSSRSTSARSNGAGWSEDERFNITHTPNLATMSRPVVTVGNRVTELEERHQPLFGSQVSAPRMQFSSTVDQQDIGMAGDPHTGIPEYMAHLDGSNRLVMKEPEAFVNMLMRAPKFEVEAYPEVNRAILTPAEQRKIMEHQRDGDRAHHVTRKALSSKARMVKTIKQQYPRGVLQVDTPATAGSELYASARDKSLDHDNGQRLHSRDRRARLDQEQNRHGRAVLHHSEELYSNPQRPLRRNAPQPNTFNRVFGGDPDAPPPRNPYDADSNSRYQYSGDRPHDIISGKVLQHSRTKPQYTQFPATMNM